MRRSVLCVLAALLLCLALLPGPAGASEQVTQIWSYTSDRSIESLAISSDGNYIVAGIEHGNVRFFSRWSSTPLWAWRETGGTTNKILQISISSDGNYVAVGSLAYGSWTSSYYVRLFSRENGTPLWSFETPKRVPSYVQGPTGDEIISVALSSDGNYLAVSTYSGSALGESYGVVYFFSRDSSTPLWSYRTDGQVNSVAISSNGSYVVAGADKLYLFSRGDNIPLWSYQGGFGSVAISSNGNYIVANSGWACHLFSRSDNTPLWSYQGVTTAAISSDGNYVVAGGVRSTDVGTIGNYFYLFSRSDNTPLWSRKTSESSSTTHYGTTAVAISSDGSYIAASDRYVSGFIGTRGLYLFSSSSGVPFWSREIPDGMLGGISSDGRYVVAHGLVNAVPTIQLFGRESPSAPSETPGEIPNQTPSGATPMFGLSGWWPWWLLYFLISALLAAWVYRDSRDRRMNRRGWTGLTFLTSAVGLVVYLKRRRPRQKHAVG